MTRNGGGEAGQDSCEPLTPREQDVLMELAKGLQNKEIAHNLSIDVKTVETHMAHIFEKLGAATRTEVLLRAIRSGLIAP